MSQNITSGGAHVLMSGLVIQFNGQPIEMNLDLPDFPLTLELDFANQENSTAQSINAQTKGESTLSLMFYNFNNPLGSGSGKPVQLGTYQNKFIYLNFRVFSISNTSDKTLHYTIYLTKELL
ncbi:DUF6864 domain-containing function [Peribacillus muralis]|uniref:DUF6864 domain-containing function n=1 Tax=Peribacillus muralis TaxID=264697 RepID=UPI003D085F6E